MSKINDGGPAFPVKSSEDFFCAAGMSLRDYFAAKAMQGLLAGIGPEDNIEVLPSLCYGMADAMLAEREKQK